MIPLTYNLKSENNVNICSTCNLLSEYFQTALINGNNEEMIAIYGTGNINLRCALPLHKKDKKGEIMHPIHYAVEGGNLSMVRWLIEQRFCPIKKIASGTGKQKRGIDIPLLTSKGRSVLQIAMENLHIDIVRYLSVDRNVSVYEVKDLALSLRILESALVAMPRNSLSIQNRGLDAKWADDELCEDDASDISGSIYGNNPRRDDSTHGSRRTGEMTDSCIICYDNSIDCVITPCGHQICCLGCAENMKNCPVCNVKCEFIRIFRP
jgi:Zinc finger, C3HC4 type (RING finger)/Ankyrin repeats (3 copies)